MRHCNDIDKYISQLPRMIFDPQDLINYDDCSVLN